MWPGGFQHTQLTHKSKPSSMFKAYRSTDWEQLMAVCCYEPEPGTKSSPSSTPVRPRAQVQAGNKLIVEASTGWVLHAYAETPSFQSQVHNLTWPCSRAVLGIVLFSALFYLTVPWSSVPPQPPPQPSTWGVTAGVQCWGHIILHCCH